MNIKNLKKSAALMMTILCMISTIVLVPQHSSFAAVSVIKPLRVVGMANFVFKGRVKAISGRTIAVNVAATTKNAKVFNKTDQTITIGTKTVVTKNTKNILLSQIKIGDIIKVFGIFNKKTGSVTVIRWIKVITQ